MKVLSFGEILWDVYPDEKYIGGAPLNFAAHFVKQGGKAYMMSALGDDELGRSALEKLKEWKINSDHVAVLKNAETGKCLVTLDKSGKPSYDLLRGVAYDHIDCAVEGEKYDALYFGTLALRGGENMRGLEKLIINNAFGEIFVDVNIRPPFYSKESVGFALGRATVLKISDEELPTVMREISGGEQSVEAAVETISERFENLKIIVITRGEHGSLAYDARTRKIYHANAEKVDVVSTVGAGDSFSAAFMYGYLSGEPIEKCLDRASKLAAFVVSKADAIPDYNF